MEPLAVLGIDPSSSYVGLALLVADGIRSELRVLRSLRIGDDPVGDLRSAFEVDAWGSIDVVVAERVPKTARADTGRQGVQGAIGWSQGWIAGLAVAAALGRVHHEPAGHYTYAEPSEWRPAMLAAASKASGRPMMAPSRRLLGPRTTSQQIREAWKAAACIAVCAMWPDPYRALCDDARSRARTSREEWQLAGVSDACEAAGIALWGLQAVQRPHPFADRLRQAQASRAHGKRGRRVR
jgi:hypothetical protein